MKCTQPMSTGEYLEELAWSGLRGSIAGALLAIAALCIWKIVR